MELLVLNFPQYDFSVRHEEGQPVIFDPVRKRHVALTPEEWVRQHVIRYLTEEKGYPAGLLSIEGSITLFKTKKRYDIAAFDRLARPLLIVECKAPEVAVSQAVVDQAVRYNLALQAPYLFITNGYRHIFLEKAGEDYRQIMDLPAYASMT